MKQKLLVICVMSFSLLSTVPYANSCAQCGKGNSKNGRQPQFNCLNVNSSQFHVGSSSRSKTGRPEFQFGNGP
jgi:hypothetical protein